MAGHTLVDGRRLLRHAGLAPGMHVADFGCGGHGHLIIPAAKTVGEEGRVYAVDIHPEALAHVEGHKKRTLLHQIIPVRGDFERQNGVSIPDCSLDRVFLIHGLWTLISPDDLSQEIARVLKPGGKAIVVDWRPRIDHPVAPPNEWRKAPIVMMRHFRDAGAKSFQERSLGNTHWYLESVF